MPGLFSFRVSGSLAWFLDHRDADAIVMLTHRGDTLRTDNHSANAWGTLMQRCDATSSNVVDNDGAAMRARIQVRASALGYAPCFETLRLGAPLFWLLPTESLIDVESPSVQIIALGHAPLGALPLDRQRNC